MNEKLLQFIWRYQYFQFTNLASTAGDSITIIHPGLYNDQQGPDFLEGKIRIGDAILVGHIELHVKTSDWDAHQHSTDERYQNVVLHVVWQHDKEMKNSLSIATLELQNYVSKILLDRYDYLYAQPVKFVACQDYLPVISELGWINWKERLGLERLRRKSSTILDRLQIYKGDWASVFWEEIAAGFGTKTNSDCFRAMASSIPIAVIRRQRESLQVLEALLFGQVGLLDRDFTEDYPLQLKKEYQYQKQKFALKSASVPVAFLRMHPTNFPTIRLAQLAVLLHQSEHLFTKIIEAENLQYVIQLFEVTAQKYWDNHYVFDKESTQSIPKKLGDSMIQTLLINCVVPIVFSYGEYRQEENLQEKSLLWLSQIASEDNKITKQWKKLGISCENALESQSLLELFNEYCNQKKCLSCNVGIAYLKK